MSSSHTNIEEQQFKEYDSSSDEEKGKEKVLIEQKASTMIN